MSQWWFLRRHTFCWRCVACSILCMFNHGTCVPISWMCKKHSAMSHSRSTATEIIIFDTGFRIFGLSAPTSWEYVVDVFAPTSAQNNPQSIGSHPERTMCHRTLSNTIQWEIHLQQFQTCWHLLRRSTSLRLALYLPLHWETARRAWQEDVRTTSLGKFKTSWILSWAASYSCNCTNASSYPTSLLEKTSQEKCCQLWKRQHIWIENVQ